MRRRRTVLENMAEMAAAAAAVHLGAHHAVAAVGRGLDRSANRIVEARPSGAALEFLLRGEQLLPAGDAGKRPGPLLVIERATPRRLGAVSPHDSVLLRREQLAPLRVAVGDGILLAVHGRAPVCG